MGSIGLPAPCWRPGRPFEETYRVTSHLGNGAFATVKRANGPAGAKLQRGMQNAAKTRLSVAAEMAAFANVTTTTRVTPHAVLDYAYWQLVIGEASTRTMPPLHDLLLKAR